MILQNIYEDCMYNDLGNFIKLESLNEANLMLDNIYLEVYNRVLQEQVIHLNNLNGCVVLNESSGNIFQKIGQLISAIFKKLMEILGNIFGFNKDKKKDKGDKSSSSSSNSSGSSETKKDDNKSEKEEKNNGKVEEDIKPKKKEDSIMSSIYNIEDLLSKINIPYIMSNQVNFVISGHQKTQEKIHRQLQKTDDAKKKVEICSDYIDTFIEDSENNFKQSLSGAGSDFAELIVKEKQFDKAFTILEEKIYIKIEFKKKDADKIDRLIEKISKYEHRLKNDIDNTFNKVLKSRLNKVQKITDGNINDAIKNHVDTKLSVNNSKNILISDKYKRLNTFVTQQLIDCVKLSNKLYGNVLKYVKHNKMTLSVAADVVRKY